MNIKKLCLSQGSLENATTKDEQFTDCVDIAEREKAFIRMNYNTVAACLSKFDCIACGNRLQFCIATMFRLAFQCFIAKQDKISQDCFLEHTD